jgi:hypothetical protein
MWNGKPAPEYEARLVIPEVTLKMIRKSLRKGYDAVLRESLFVRAISILEVFLIDTIKWLFIHRRDLFQRDGVVEIPQRELISADSIEALYGKLIGKECRDIQNRGISEIRKYYGTRLGIVFENGGTPDKYLDEIFERRHLIVHRLGKTDARYRKEYSTRSSRVCVDEQYFLKALSHIDTLTAFVHAEVKGLVRKSQQSEIKTVYYTVRLEIADISATAIPFFRTDHRIECDSEIVRLGDILLTHLGDKRERSLILSGSKKVIDFYIASLRELERQGELVIVQKVLIESGQKCNLPATVMIEISKILGAGPIPRNGHKAIATKLGLSNKQTYAAIALIEANPLKYKQKKL